jgi:hypothetical protein
MPGRLAKRGRSISNVLVLLAATTWFDSALSLSPTTTAFVPSTTSARGCAAVPKLQVYPALTGCRGVAGSRRDLTLRAKSRLQWCASAMEEGPRQSFDLSSKPSNARRQSATAAFLGIPAWAGLSTAAAAATEPQNAVAAAHLLSQAASASASASVTVDALVGGMLAGAIAGAAVDLALYPIDTIKTRLQTIGSIQLEAGEWRQLYSGGTSALL